MLLRMNGNYKAKRMRLLAPISAYRASTWSRSRAVKVVDTARYLPLWLVRMVRSSRAMPGTCFCRIENENSKKSSSSSPKSLTGYSHGKLRSNWSRSVGMGRLYQKYKTEFQYEGTDPAQVIARAKSPEKEYR